MIKSVEKDTEKGSVFIEQMKCEKNHYNIVLLVLVTSVKVPVYT